MSYPEVRLLRLCGGYGGQGPTSDTDVRHMYSITTTPGFIINSRPYGEAGKMLSIFTRDLGLVTATAQGIRLEKSKLRYYAQVYSFGQYSFVRGKEYWRLTSAQNLFEDENINGDGLTVGDKKENLEFIARIALILNRLLHGEEVNRELFHCIYECYRFLQKEKLSNEQMQTLESITVARILHLLGYIGNDDELNEYFKSNIISITILEKLVSKRTIINKHINKALKESHL